MPMNDAIKTVYYYCSPNTFEKILKDKKLWLCDMMKTNDYREINYVLDDIKNTVKTTRFEGVLSEEDATLVKIAVKKRLQFYTQCCHWLAICFSTLSDDLGQWRAYGADGRGFAIGFDTEKLKKLEEHNCIHFEEIKYGDRAKSKFVKKAIEQLVDDLRVCVNRNSIRSPEGLNQKGINIIKAWGDKLTSQICFFKSESFSAEHEHRLCYTRMIMAEDLKSILDIENKPNSLLHNLKATMKRNELHLRLEKDFPIDAIKEIVIGPQCNISEYEMKIILAINGIDFNNIIISTSKATYRH